MAEQRESVSGDTGLRAVPDRKDPDVYGHIDFFDGVQTHRLSIGVWTTENLMDCPEDVVLNMGGVVVKHPYGGAPRPATEDERAAVGWTW